jgi:hypothetical protein
MSSPVNSSAEFCSPSFDRALAELPLTSIDTSFAALASTSNRNIKPNAINASTSSREWPDEDELAMVNEVEAEFERKKRKRDDDDGGAVLTEAFVPPAVKDISQEDGLYEGHPAYVASKFGGIGAYMQNKRMKL